MSFIQYESISNHTDKRSIDEFFENNPDFLKEKYIVEHKYDGANFQVIFNKSVDPEKKSSPVFASRNCILGEGDKFFNYKNTVKLPKYKLIFENIQTYLENSNLASINLFGELYGSVQDRVKYFDEKENKLIFFDVYFDSVLQTKKDFIEWGKKLNLDIVEHYLIGTLEECMAFEVKSIITDHGTLIEGVVIKPFDKSLPKDSPNFYIKIKNSGFDEIKPAAPKPKEQKPENLVNKLIDDEKYPGVSLFKDYLTLNRARSAFSKKSWTKKDMTNLATEILFDAKKDFDLDHKYDLDIKILQKIFLKDVFKLIKDLNMFND